MGTTGENRDRSGGRTSRGVAGGQDLKEAHVRRRTSLAAIAALALLLTVSMSTVAAARTGVFHLTLTGDQEATATCAPPTVCGDPDAIAHVVLVVNPNTDKVCFVAAWSDIDGTVAAAHIHPAPAGVPGPVAVPLFSGAFDGTDMTRGCVSANGLAGAILANPSGYYINIHSSVYPPGAVRAQLG
jgi:hypothetical protein